MISVNIFDKTLLRHHSAQELQLHFVSPQKCFLLIIETRFEIISSEFSARMCFFTTQIRIVGPRTIFFFNPHITRKNDWPKKQFIFIIETILETDQEMSSFIQNQQPWRCFLLIIETKMKMISTWNAFEMFRSIRVVVHRFGPCGHDLFLK